MKEQAVSNMPDTLDMPAAKVGDLRRQRYGFFVRKERWGLSWQGWAVILAAAATMFGLFLLGVYPFLAVTQREDADVLVVEGWVHDYAIRSAVEEFRHGSYHKVFTTGGPVEGIGHYINEYQTEASVGADRLNKKGLPAESVQMVPSRVMDRDRTYGSALALSDWFRSHNLDIHKINVITEGVHARRSRLLFQEAFGPNVVVGVIAVMSPDYDSHRWWRYSQGVKDVVGESVGYVYSKCFFWPGLPASQVSSQKSEAMGDK
jgi:uncharacterized SAM-binding protein YcdF (DUF218 family)